MTESWFTGQAVTQPDVTGDVKEVLADRPPAAIAGLTMISTIAHQQATSLPIALPELVPPSGVASEGFLFRIGPGVTMVSVRLDTQLLAQRERVRKLNESLRRSTQG